ncbi:transporter [Rhodococcus sp. (in: high G+C Gram-positive bacteria)]|uniref:thiolase C-terminal domain-containing protein n=1 Tax=Rhodococcus sp. TaxID=1831 RepID=UPI00257C2BA5|nr:transporter [Rhodococcus sp. (in: high G+C Gram-positive bacteria)]MBQ9052409.1 transporter [Rhodococcus sp. (in: high G+C Gram-positive bacteria)]
MSSIALRGAAAVVGVAEHHYRRGEGPHGEQRMTLEAIVAACADAGISPREIDGFVSYAGGSNDGAVIGGALMVNDVKWSNMMWGGGGGTVAAAVNNAVVAIASGQADVVAVYRAMSQEDTGRLGYAKYHYGPHFLAHGVGSPAQVCALRTQRLLEHDGVPREAMRSLVLAAYQHAQNNPTAQGYGRPLDIDTYENSRLITEPFHLFDCSRESDGAVALILVSSERARDLRQTPAYVLAGAQGAPGGYSSIIDNDNQYTSAGFAGVDGRPGVADRLWAAAGIGPSDVDVVQVYENFSGPAVSALIDHGLAPSGPAAGDVLTVENLTAPTGKLPINTSGGNIADSFVNGMGLAVEAVRQLRGTSTNQVADAKTSLFIGGPMAPIVSSTLFAHGDAL